jgi:hypothetical protein
MARTTQVVLNLYKLLRTEEMTESTNFFKRSTNLMEELESLRCNLASGPF